MISLNVFVLRYGKRLYNGKSFSTMRETVKVCRSGSTVPTVSPTKGPTTSPTTSPTDSPTVPDSTYCMNLDIHPDDYPDDMSWTLYQLTNRSRPDAIVETWEYHTDLRSQGEAVKVMCFLTDIIHYLKRNIDAKWPTNEVVIFQKQIFMKYLFPDLTGLVNHFRHPFFYRRQILSRHKSLLKLFLLKCRWRKSVCVCGK